MWINYIIGISLIILGLAVHIFKCYFLISGYNTMPKEKKANVNIRPLAKLIGIYSYINGGVFLFFGFLYTIGFTPGMAVPMSILVITTVLLLVKSQKYDGNMFDEDGKLREGARKKFGLLIAGTIVVLSATGVLLFFSAQPTQITLQQDGIQIHGLYGEIYHWEEIDSMKLQENLPTIEMRTNGSALGNHLKGHFRTAEYGGIKLFVDSSVPAFIYMETGDGMVIFNLNTTDATREFFEKIIKEWK